MAYLEYPKHVYKGEGDDRVSKVVKDLAGEAAAAEEGYEALPPAPPDTPELRKASPLHLEYPKFVYRGDESFKVLDAEEEAARAADGYLSVEAQAAVDAAATGDGEPAEDAAEPKKRGRKPKA